MNNYDVCVIGGGGHIGLPLGVALALSGFNTMLLDINEDVLEKIQAGIFPFDEKGGEEKLKEALVTGRLHTSSDESVISSSETIMMIIGTPVDEYLNPQFDCILKVIDKNLAHFRDDQVFVLRSTVYPGTSEQIRNYFSENGKKIHVAYCPERVVEGKAFEEFKSLPQIVSSFDEKGLARANELFSKISEVPLVELAPVEAELAKLFSNAWRYIRFAVANQFFMIATERGVDYHNVYTGMTEGYERNKDMPGPGFAAGPCLLKDTMQLSAFNKNNFFLGHAAMLVNEGLPNFIIQDLCSRVSDIGQKTIGILGMTFKANSDDIRDSLSFKLRKVSKTVAKAVVCHDPFFSRGGMATSAEALMSESDIVVLATPHSEYADIDPQKYPEKIFVDVWNMWNLGYIINES